MSEENGENQHPQNSDCNDFPLMSHFENVRFCADRVATARADRVFSISGVILSSRRLLTSDDNFEAQLFRNINRSLWEERQKKQKITEIS